MPVSKRAKAISISIALLILGLILFWDVLPARARFHRLCATEAGVRIYKRIVLGPEFRGMELPNSPGLYRQTPLGQRYPHSYEEFDPLPGGPGRIVLVRDVVRDRNTGEALGTYTSYFYGGGWFENAVSPAGTGGGQCSFGPDGFKAFLEQIFNFDKTQ